MKSKKIAHVEESRCVACGACANVCPRGAIGVVQGCFARVNTDLCVGCGLCARTCPVGCISVLNREGENG
ncbi:4Fe-4S binding protein [Treponema zioleckii]|uniref:4Fe-4S binding protein n=1 Tax=Treponema zioleckii TaxID=331680 RepID=UPI00168B6A82|nr:4Fe-4S binding protein [Treponema zioleckii]